MHGADGVSVDVLAERLAGTQREVSELSEEQQRMRVRLHNLEGFAAAYLDQQRENRRGEERQYRRLELRLELLAVVVALAAIVVPILVAVSTGK